MAPEHPSFPSRPCLWEAAGHTLHPGPRSCSAGDGEGGPIRPRRADPGQSPLPPPCPPHTRAVLQPGCQGDRSWQRPEGEWQSGLARDASVRSGTHPGSPVLESSSPKRRGEEGPRGRGGSPGRGAKLVRFRLVWSRAEGGDRERRRAVVEYCGVCVRVCVMNSWEGPGFLE